LSWVLSSLLLPGPSEASIRASKKILSTGNGNKIWRFHAGDFEDDAAVSILVNWPRTR
jgi:hypothetical protein